MLRVGVVGVGMMGKHHARIYSELAKEGKIELVGIADKNLKRGEEIASKFNTQAFDDYHALLGKVDAVSIAVPTSLHMTVALDFIESGTNVLIEKPIAESIESASKIIKAAEKKNVIIAVGHIERFNPPVLKLKEVIRKGLLGDIVTMNAKRVGPMDTRIADVGVIVDLGVHDIDVMSFISGYKIKEVYAKARNVKHPAKVEDYALILLGFEHNIDGIIETNRLTPHKTRTLTVVGTKGIAHLNYIEQSLRIFDGEWFSEAEIQKKEPLRVELEHFINCVEKGEKPLVGGEDGLYALRVALTALESALSGKVIKIS